MSWFVLIESWTSFSLLFCSSRNNLLPDQNLWSRLCVCSMTSILCKNAQKCNSLGHLLVIYVLWYFKLDHMNSTLWVHAECFLFTNWTVVCSLLTRCILKSPDALDLWRKTLVWGIYFQSHPRTFLSSGQMPKHNMQCKIDTSRSYVRKYLFHLQELKKRWDHQVQSGYATVYFQLYFLTNCTYW